MNEEPKHTPGPWEVCLDRGNPQKGWREIFAGNRSVVDSDSFERHRGGETEFHCGVRISEENARLISAAPDLIRVAIDLMEFWDNGTPVHPGAEVVAELRAAIAKATGK